jgi:sorbitol/mannitol transport system substrate-binding protein
MKRLAFPLVAAVCLSAISAYAQQKTVTICAVNNGPMIELKKLSAKFEAKNPDIKLNWVIVEENVLRQKVTLDVTQHGGLYDLVYIGLYDTPIFAKQGNLLPFDNLPAEYEIDDVFKSIRDGLSYDGKLYALPFYGESSMLMYRKDLLEVHGDGRDEEGNRRIYSLMGRFHELLKERNPHCAIHNARCVFCMRVSRGNLLFTRGLAWGLCLGGAARLAIPRGFWGAKMAPRPR